MSPLPVQTDRGGDSSSSIQLFCFPSVGGNGSLFNNWARKSDDKVGVRAFELPGHGARWKETPISDFQQLTPLIVRELKPFMSAPFAFFGHSLGALIAFEITRELRRSGLVQPLHLFVSGYPAPQMPRFPSRRHTLAEPLFLESISEFLPVEAVRNSEFIKLITPALRADLALSETYEYLPEPPLECPITAFGGTEDWAIKNGSIRYWMFQTKSGFDMHLFNGDHFYLQNNSDALYGKLREHLEM